MRPLKKTARIAGSWYLGFIFGAKEPPLAVAMS